MLEYPQGTNIGSITFQAVINDAAQSCCKYWKYVDDLTFAENRDCTSDSNLQSYLNAFLKWSNSGNLTMINVKPSIYVLWKTLLHVLI